MQRIVGRAPGLPFVSACATLFFIIPGLLAAQESLSPNRWVKIHEQKPGDEVQFRRQAHGGSCFDSKRRQLILFGSDTHGRDWTNSPLIFDTGKREWRRICPNDDRATYVVNEEGIPVAGTDGVRPWAMHTFGAVIHDSSRDELIVASAPKHMVPGRFTDAVSDLWPQIRRFPTWTFTLETRTWRPLPCKPVDFFPHCATFDTDRNVVLGYRPDGIYELSGEPRGWKRLTNRVFLGGWHSNCVYDARHQALVVFGTNTNSNEIEVFYPESGKHRLMPARGVRPPPDQHNPMAYDPKLGKTVVMVDRKEGGSESTETWLYDLGSDSWSRLDSASLPFACGMNYNMEFSAIDECLYLVTGDHRLPTTVWALRLD